MNEQWVVFDVLGTSRMEMIGRNWMDEAARDREVCHYDHGQPAHHPCCAPPGHNTEAQNYSVQPASLASWRFRVSMSERMVSTEPTGMTRYDSKTRCLVLSGVEMLSIW